MNKPLTTEELIPSAMTQEHEAFLGWLRAYAHAPLTATVLREHWEKGERYYIDNRVNIKGRRREFNRLNSMMKEE